MVRLRGTPGTAGLLLLLLWATPVQAQTKPADVLQAVETITQDLARFQAADLLTAKPASDRSLKPRRPRHVLQQARQVFLDLQQLRSLNGQAAEPLAPLLVEETSPAQVKAQVDAIAASLAALRPVYGIAGDPQAAAHKAGAKPQDVYAALLDVQGALRTLGVPTIVPNDVLRVAMMVRDNLHQVLRARGVEPPALGAPSSGRKPGDVFQAGLELIARLARLVEQDGGIEVAGGILVPETPPTPITPGHVIELLQGILADVNSIKFALALKEPLHLLPPPAGATPSQVFDVVSDATRATDALIARLDGGA